MFGILTEPMRGDIYKHKDDKHSDMDLVFKADDGHVSYVPKAHVQFLEQAGIRVVPVDYRLPAEERFEMYDQLNGLYITGDSQMAVTDQVFKDAFASTLWYLEDATFEKKDHFPVFMMGNSLQTLTRAR